MGAARLRLELEQPREKQAELEEVHGGVASGLTGVLGSRGLGQAGLLWLQRGFWAKDGERLPSSFPLMRNASIAARGSLLEACPLLCDAGPRALEEAIPNQGKCPTCGCPERSSLALGPWGPGRSGCCANRLTPLPSPPAIP